MNGRYVSYMKKEIPLLLLVLALSLLMAAVITLGTYLWKIIYDQLFQKEDMHLFWIIVLLSGSVIILTHVLRAVHQHVLMRLQYRLYTGIRKEFLLEVMHYRYSFFLTRHTGEFIKHATEDCFMIAQGLVKMITGGVYIVQVTFWLAFFLFVFPPASLIYFAISLMLVFWVMLWRKKFAGMSFAIGAATDTLWRNLSEVFGGIKMIKLDLLKEKSMRRLDGIFRDLSVKEKRCSFFSNMIWNIFYFFPWLALAFFVLALVPGIITGQYTLGLLVLCFLFTERFLSPLNASINILISHQEFRDAEKRIQTYRTKETEREGTIEFAGIKDGITVEHVHFAYENSLFALRDINLSIPCGKHTAIHGKSGCGKSSLVALIMRLFDASSGAVLLDGVPHTQFTLESLRDRITVVPQDIPIYLGTVRENIDIKDALSDAEVSELIQAVRLDGFVSRLPEGLETKITADGLDISGGERRRLGIARALGLKQHIFIFDEVTASLDKETEKYITDYLYTVKRNWTTLTITHNPQILKLMDVVYTMKDGVVAPAGLS